MKLGASFNSSASRSQATEAVALAAVSGLCMKFCNEQGTTSFHGFRPDAPTPNSAIQSTLTTMQQPVNQPGVALITGATGIQGSHLLQRLAQSPRWSKIYAVSRSEPSINNGAAPLLRNAVAQQVAV